MSVMECSNVSVAYQRFCMTRLYRYRYINRSSHLNFFFFLNSVLRPFQDYFSSYETGRGAKMGEPQEKTPDTPASRTWLVSHVARAGVEPTPDTAVR